MLGNFKHEESVTNTPLLGHSSSEPTLPSMRITDANKAPVSKVASTLTIADAYSSLNLG